MHWISAVLTAWQWHKVVYGHSKCILCGNAVKWICSSVANRAPILQTSPAMTAVHLNASTYLHELFTKDNGFEPVKWQECFKSGNKIKSQCSLLRHLHQEPHFSVRNCWITPCISTKFSHHCFIPIITMNNERFTKRCLFVHPWSKSQSSSPIPHAELGAPEHKCQRSDNLECPVWDALCLILFPPRILNSTELSTLKHSPPLFTSNLDISKQSSIDYSKIPMSGHSDIAQL